MYGPFRFRSCVLKITPPIFLFCAQDQYLIHHARRLVILFNAKSQPEKTISTYTTHIFELCMHALHLEQSTLCESLTHHLHHWYSAKESTLTWSC